MKEPDYDLLVVGGGLAGLAVAQLVARSGWRVLVLEKGHYPHHKVCGEYLSEEVRPFLMQLGVPLSQWQLPVIRRLEVSNHAGRVYSFPLALGGFGLSRFLLDDALAQQARLAGAVVKEGEMVLEVVQEDGAMVAVTRSGKFTARLAVGSWGKRGQPDVAGQRRFIAQRPNVLNQFIAVKHHFELAEVPDDLIRLDNFLDGYAGLSRVENGVVCCCYLSRASNLRKAGGNIGRMEREILQQNPRLKEVFTSARPLYERPLSISQVSFSEKEQSLNGMLLLGDTAGLIAPLCGNGMSMALRAAWLAAPLLLDRLEGRMSQVQMLAEYQKRWKDNFSVRLKTGRVIQAMFGSEWPTAGMLGILGSSPRLAQWVIKQTHGQPFGG